VEMVDHDVHDRADNTACRAVYLGR
jgi:hypothetical protein